MKPEAKPRSLVLILRPLPEAEATARRVADLGWTPLISPLLRVEPVQNSMPDPAGYDAAIVTSARAIGGDLPALPVFAVGEKTAERLRAQGHEVPLVAPDAASLAKRITALPTRPKRLLHVSGMNVAFDLATALHPDTVVERHIVYRAMPQDLTWEARDGLRRQTIGAVLLTSPRIAALFAEMSDGNGARLLALSAAIAAASPGATEIAAEPILDALLARLGPFEARRSLR